MPLIPVTTKPVASPVSSESFPPAPGGMNISMPPNQIADTEAVYLQDILLDQPGYARRRGPVTPMGGVAALPRPASGQALTLDPGNNLRYAALTGTNSTGFLTMYSANLGATADFTWPFALPTAPPANPYPLTGVSAGLLSGTMVGTSASVNVNTSPALGYWGGGVSANYTTGTLTVSRGGTAVTGSGTAWSTNATPGMWLFAATDDPMTGAFIGQVKTVNSDTSITLVSGSLYAATAKTYTLTSVRGLIPKIAVGTITCATTSKQVNGGNTKFQTQGVNAACAGCQWDVYRARDMHWIGTVDKTQPITDTQVTLVANATTAMADEAYVIVPNSSAIPPVTLVGTPAVNDPWPGFLTSVYSDRQWYANNPLNPNTTYRLWFSDTTDPEILDLTFDGNWLPINSTGDLQEPIVSIAGAYNALVVNKQSETFGVFGTDPTTFQVTKLADDGALSPMSVQQFGGGVIWAGREAIHFFDGTQVTDLTTSKFGPFWRQAMQTFDPTKYRMWSMIERRHYFLHIENLTPPISVTKGNTVTTPSHWIVAVNLDTGAVTLWQNAKFRGSVRLPALQGDESWFVYNDGTKGVFALASNFFDTTGNDSTVEGVANAGPDFFFESKKMDGGSPTRLKRFTYWLLNYLVVGDVINIDTVLGLNTAGVTTASGATGFPASSTWTVDRLRFLKKDRLLAFRLWQNSNAVTDFRIGNFEIGFKPMRPGRI